VESDNSLHVAALEEKVLELEVELERYEEAIRNYDIKIAEQQR
jgi:hypothetical protein